MTGTIWCVRMTQRSALAEFPLSSGFKSAEEPVGRQRIHFTSLQSSLATFLSFFFILHPTGSLIPLVHSASVAHSASPLGTPPLHASPLSYPPAPLLSLSVVKVCLESQSQRSDPLVPTLTASFSGLPSPSHSWSRVAPPTPSCSQSRGLKP